MNSIIQGQLGKIRALCKQHKVKSLYSFGSVNTPEFTDESDIDLLIDFEAGGLYGQLLLLAREIRTALQAGYRLSDTPLAVEPILHPRSGTIKALDLWVVKA